MWMGGVVVLKQVGTMLWRRGSGVVALDLLVFCLSGSEKYDINKFKKPKGHSFSVGKTVAVAPTGSYGNT